MILVVIPYTYEGTISKFSISCTKVLTVVKQPQNPTTNAYNNPCSVRSVEGTINFEIIINTASNHVPNEKNKVFISECMYVGMSASGRGGGYVYMKCL